MFALSGIAVWVLLLQQTEQPRSPFTLTINEQSASREGWISIDLSLQSGASEPLSAYSQFGSVCRLEIDPPLPRSGRVCTQGLLSPFFLREVKPGEMMVGAARLSTHYDLLKAYTRTYRIRAIYDDSRFNKWMMESGGKLSMVGQLKSDWYVLEVTGTRVSVRPSFACDALGATSLSAGLTEGGKT